MSRLSQPESGARYFSESGTGSPRAGDNDQIREASSYSVLCVRLLRRRVTNGPVPENAASQINLERQDRSGQADGPCFSRRFVALIRIRLGRASSSPRSSGCRFFVCPALFITSRAPNL